MRAPPAGLPAVRCCKGPLHAIEAMELQLTALATQAFAAFSLAIVGGLHCAGMCGGIVGALQLNRPREVSAARLAVGYHGGRLASYSLAGVLAGTLGAALYAADVVPVQAALMLIGSLMLLAIGASMFGRGAWLRRLEPPAHGSGAWSRRLRAASIRRARGCRRLRPAWPGAGFPAAWSMRRCRWRWWPAARFRGRW